MTKRWPEQALRGAAYDVAFPTSAQKTRPANDFISELLKPHITLEEARSRSYITLIFQSVV